MHSSLPTQSLHYVEEEKKRRKKKRKKNSYLYIHLILYIHISQKEKEIRKKERSNNCCQTDKSERCIINRQKA
jgi:hypothetical protein